MLRVFQTEHILQYLILVPRFLRKNGYLVEWIETHECAPDYLFARQCAPQAGVRRDAGVVPEDEVFILFECYAHVVIAAEVLRIEIRLLQCESLGMFVVHNGDICPAQEHRLAREPDDPLYEGAAAFLRQVEDDNVAALGLTAVVRDPVNDEVVPVIEVRVHRSARNYVWGGNKEAHKERKAERHDGVGEKRAAGTILSDR